VELRHGALPAATPHGSVAASPLTTRNRPAPHARVPVWRVVRSATFRRAVVKCLAVQARVEASRVDRPRTGEEPRGCGDVLAIDDNGQVAALVELTRGRPVGIDEWSYGTNGSRIREGVNERTVEIVYEAKRAVLTIVVWQVRERLLDRCGGVGGDVLT
jgi:hypothetical protein